jgi:thiol-disulfide isomerase/thioredoxin
VKRILLSCFAFALLALPNFAQEANGLRKAPELAFHLPGQGDALLSQLRGKVVCVSFILTTCPHCQEASRVMTKLQQEYASRGFQAVDLAINGLDEGRTPQQADALVTMFARNFQVGFPVGWIPRDQFMSFMGFSLAEYTVVPQLALIDRKGYIHYQTAARGGAHDEATLRPQIEELLAQGTGASAHSSSKTRTAVAKRTP